jgi:hypothetical protein
MEQPRTSLKRARPVAAIAIAAVGVLAAVLFAVRLSRDPVAPPPAAPSAPERDASRGAPPGEAGGTGEDLPPDRLLEAVSANALYRAAIEGDFVRRWAVVIANLAEGASPRRRLAFLAPSRPFTVTSRGGVTVIDPASYQRYDAFGDAVASLDAQALARAYRALRPPLEAAYRALGYPDASIDRAIARALDRIEGAPVEEGDVAVVGEGGVFLFREGRLEDLSDVEKHLLRAGPRNTGLVQAKAREVRQALGLPARGAGVTPTPAGRARGER